MCVGPADAGPKEEYVSAHTPSPAGEVRHTLPVTVTVPEAVPLAQGKGGGGYMRRLSDGWSKSVGKQALE